MRNFKKETQLTTHLHSTKEYHEGEVQYTALYSVDEQKECGNMSYVEVGWLLEVYILSTLRVISEQVLTCNSVHSWQFYSAAPLGSQTT